MHSPTIDGKDVRKQNSLNYHKQTKTISQETSHITTIQTPKQGIQVKKKKNSTILRQQTKSLKQTHYY